MNTILVIIIGLIAVGILVYMLLKKNDIKMTLLSLGLLLMYVAIIMGKKVVVTMTTGQPHLIRSRQLSTSFQVH